MVELQVVKFDRGFKEGGVVSWFVEGKDQLVAIVPKDEIAHLVQKQGFLFGIRCLS